MREWRVGTISMGASLILFGVLLFLSQWQKIDLLQIFFSWWPFILIVLGLEIVVYIIFSKQKTVLIKYDFFSIIFIGVLGTIALGVMFLTFSGIVHEVRSVVHAQEETYDLPPYITSVPSHINRIVIEVGEQPVRLEGTNQNAVQIFGTYRTSRDEISAKIKKAEDYVSVLEAGDTLFVRLKSLPEKKGLFQAVTDSDLLILLPATVNVEFKRKQYSWTTVRPGMLKADWYIDDPGEVVIPLLEESDVRVIVNQNQNPVGKTGNGTHHIYVTSNDPEQLNVFVQP